MALVKGTNCGFVTTAPTTNPSDGRTGFDNMAWTFKDNAPTGAIKITEIGWWCDNATEEANYEVGIYDDNAGVPNNVVGTLSQTNAKGTEAGWKRVTGLNISVTAGQTYWIASQLDNTITQTNIMYTSSEGNIEYKYISNLPSPWSSGTARTWKVAIYAVWEAAPATPSTPATPETPLGTIGTRPLEKKYKDKEYIGEDDFDKYGKGVTINNGW